MENKKIVVSKEMNLDDVIPFLKKGTIVRDNIAQISFISIWAKETGYEIEIGNGKPNPVYCGLEFHRELKISCSSEDETRATMSNLEKLAQTKGLDFFRCERDCDGDIEPYFILK